MKITKYVQSLLALLLFGLFILIFTNSYKVDTNIKKCKIICIETDTGKEYPCDCKTVEETRYKNEFVHKHGSILYLIIMILGGLGFYISKY